MSAKAPTDKPLPTDVALDEDSGANWYAEAALTSCSEWEEQDPELYRAMAAPRPAPDGTADEDSGFADMETWDHEVFPAEATPFEVGEDERQPEGYEELDTLLPEDEPTLPGTAAPQGLEPQHDEEPADLADFPGAIEEWCDSEADAEDEPSWIGRTALQVGVAPAWLEALHQRRTRARQRAPEPSPILVPAYELQCGTVEGEPPSRLSQRRSAPSRIARRLWQRDLERIRP